LEIREVKKLKLLPGFEQVLKRLPLENKNEYLHEMAITAIIKKDNKYLITRRSPTKKRFPGKWTVPGGKMETDDYLKLPKDTEFYWYNVLENTLRREVKEEVGIDITNIQYLTSLATIHKDGRPSLVISCLADYVNGEIKLKIDENDKFAWISLKEAQKYDLLDGIYDELIMADKRKNEKKKIGVAIKFFKD
ncbi:MAG TPA: NUDIX domain-containing protein, partial [Candidatus Vogelbacteria bacterium]|nr:NUDIX domain-containing protein [Candidatus Vogelbacteria bacterium]